ncbi:MAG: Pls/PosA family non-ribosomal peptide synthetase, partial [Tepidisphaeraceae bacterium]
TDDFFTDLGGHSLLAARFVSVLRNEPRFHDLSVLDVYHHPTIARLAAAIDKRASSRTATKPRIASPARRLRINPLFYPAQAVSWLGLVGIISAEWLAPCIAYQAVSPESRLGAFLAAGAAIVLLPFFTLPLALAAKWLLVGRFRAGSVPLWSFAYLRWWLFHRILALAPTHSLIGTPLLNVYYRLMGARIGKNVFLGTDHLGAFDLISIGDNTHINLETNLLGHSVEAGRLIFGPIDIGRDCFVGTRASLRPHTRMEDGSALEPLSLLPQNGVIPARQRFSGSPAGRSADIPAAPANPARTTPGILLLHILGLFAMPLVPGLAGLPGIVLILHLNRICGGHWFLLAAPLAAISFVLLMLLEIAALKWLLLGRVKPGSYGLGSTFYVRKRFIDQLMDMSLTILGPVYATLYLIPWFRLLGAKLGKRVEFSTAHNTTPDLLAAAEGSFLADSVSLGAPRIENGHLHLLPVSIGQRTFIGNSALVSPGSTIGDGCLIGVMSLPPSPDTTNGTSWLGSPAIFLPQRLGGRSFSEESTYHPTPGKYAARLCIEFFRIVLPPTFSIALASLLYHRYYELEQLYNRLTAMAMFPVLYVVAGLMTVAIVVAAKWLLMGRYGPAQHPLWSGFVWRTELFTALHEHLADPFIVRLCLGTPAAAWFFRLLGARVGKRVYMDTTSLTEFDLIEIGDDVSLNQDSVVQTHLFEDRVMKMDHIRIEPGVSVGARAIVLYDSCVRANTTLDDLSLVMRGESLPADATFRGVPARRV